MTIEPAIGKEASMEMVTAGKVSGALAGLLHWPGPRLLLRPRGRSAGLIIRRKHALAHYNWLADGAAYITRAEAAQAVHEEGDLSKLTTQS